MDRDTAADRLVAQQARSIRVALVLGLVLTALAGVLLARDLAATRSYLQTQGTIVVDHRTEFPARELARVRFGSDRGPIEVELTLGNDTLLRRGDSMPLLYDPEDPTHARAAGLSGWPTLILVLGIPGLVTLVAGALASLRLGAASRRP